MKKEKCLLTDFNTERRKGIDIESVKKALEDLKSKKQMPGLMHCIFGELGNPSSFEVSLNKASHSIKNIILEDNKIYGDVEILNTLMGKVVSETYNNLDNINFGIRSTGSSPVNGVGKIVIERIFTWDIID